jgi:hypothetical protein
MIMARYGNLYCRNTTAMNQFKIRLEKLSHCVGRVSRLVASGVPTAGNPHTELFAKFKINKTINKFFKSPKNDPKSLYQFPLSMKQLNTLLSWY